MKRWDSDEWGVSNYFWDNERWDIGFSFLTDYYFYANSSFKDLVAGVDMQVNLVSGRFPGNVGEDVATIVDGKLNTSGAYVQLIKKSEDISDGVWSGYLNALSATTYQAPSAWQGAAQDITTTDSVEYTLSFWAKVAPGGRTSGTYLRYTDSETGTDVEEIVLTETLTLYKKTVLGRAGGGIVTFGWVDGNSSDWEVVTLTDFQVTETSSRMPYASNDSAVSTLSVPANNSSNDGTQHGYFYVIANHQGLTDAFDGVDSDPATSEIQFTWTPMFDQGDIGADYNIFTTNNAATTGLWYDDVNSLIKFTDGTNTASVAHTAVNGTEVTISIVLDGANSQMVVGVNTTGGTPATFDGHVPLGTYFSYAWGSSAWQEIGQPVIYKEIQTAGWL